MSERDPFRPSRATSEGQMLDFTESLRHSRYGRPVAIVMLAGGLLAAIVIALATFR
jgi:uncharacterized protein (DUF2062 family)